MATNVYDLFISYSSRDTSDAEKIKKVAEDHGLRVFLSSEELVAGTKWPEKIIEALSTSWEVCVLFTQDSLSREWVISEWSVALFMNKVVTPILKGVGVSAIPERLRAFQAADFYKVDLFIDALVARKQQRLPFFRDFAEYCSLKSEQAIQETLFSPDTSGSPFRFLNSINLASESVFFSGQNYYWPLVTNEEPCRKAVLTFLKSGQTREVRVMICDFEFSPAVVTWCKVNGEEYRDHLKKATINLANWVTEAEAQGLNLKARVVPFVPVSVTFIDYLNPESQQSRLLLTPNAYESRSGRRPSIYFSRCRHRDIYDNYYEPYNTWFSQGRNVTQVDVMTERRHR